MRPVRLLLGLHQPLTAAVLTLALGVAAVGGPAAPWRVFGPAARSVALLLPAGGPSPLETPGTTVRVSLDAQNQQLTSPSGSPSISADGRYIVFRTSRLVRNFDLGIVYLRDRVGGTTTEVAHGSIVAGVAVTFSTVSQPVISGDGRWVAFVSGAPKAGPGQHTILIWDRTNGTVGPAMPAGTSASASDPALSFDGRFLAFRTPDPLVSGDTNELDDVYVLDRDSGGFDRVSVASGGAGGIRGVSGEPSISADGRYVAFTSTMIRLVQQTVPVGRSQIYLRDRTAGSTILLSVGPGGAVGDLASEHPSISASGGAVAFASHATDLVPGDGNGLEDVFVWSAGAPLVRASVGGGGGDADGPSVAPAISADGGSVAFASSATNLVPGDTNDVSDIFLRDLVTGVTTRVDVAVGPSQANGRADAPAISGTGRFVAFESSAGNLVTNDTNQLGDVFVRDRTPAIGFTPVPVDFGVAAAGSPTATRALTVTSAGSGPVSISTLGIAPGSAAGYSIVSDGCSGLSLHAGQSCQAVVGFAPSGSGPTTGSLSVPNDAPSGPQAAPLTAIVLPGQGNAPTITLSPKVGPPGTVVIVSGTGFAAGQPVSLTWSPGITPTPLGPIAAAPDGTLSAQVLVLPNDVEGPRLLTASSIVAGASGVPASAGFLVVPHTAAPPVSPYLRLAILGPERPLILRH
ncbi:MAG: PD40 domain-containing protein [Chloroflexi bacterium]|nr:PD40 domain-containing protein [Chloroflexota bacterium]